MILWPPQFQFGGGMAPLAPRLGTPLRIQYDFMLKNYQIRLDVIFFYENHLFEM